MGSIMLNYSIVFGFIIILFETFPGQILLHMVVNHKLSIIIMVSVDWVNYWIAIISKWQTIGNSGSSVTHYFYKKNSVY